VEEVMTIPVSFADLKVQECPFPAYDALRDEAPVYFDESTKLFVLTRYEDVRMCLMDQARFSNMTGLVQTRLSPAVAELYERKGWPPVPTLLNNDPPSHKFYRSFIDKAFGAKRATSLAAYIERSVTELIEAFIDTKGEIEFVYAFAVRLPLQVIMDLVGVPRAMLDQMIIWADAGTESTSPVLTPERELQLIELSIEFQQYFAKLAESYRGKPAENLLSDLVNDVVDGRSLTITELLSLVQIVMAAGYDTTTSTISSAVAGLIDVPERQEMLRKAPERIPSYIDEILRLYAPLQGLFRRAVEDVTIHGVTIPKGAVVNVRWGAANRDPRKFADPGVLDMDRANLSQNLSFGTGIHTCVGRPLARTEVRIALEHLLQRTSAIRYSRGNREKSWLHKHNFVTWGPQRLFIELDRR
jgi:cytochrome P450